MPKLAEQLKQGAGQAWESLSEGWRELSARASSALTRFRPTQTSTQEASRDDEDWLVPGRWAFVAADVIDEDDRLVVRVEAPGMRREDFQISVDGQVLSVRGEKRLERCASGARYRLLQCAYGSFRRDIELPVTVKADKTQASYQQGVLRIELPKADNARLRRIPVHAA